MTNLKLNWHIQCFQESHNLKHNLFLSLWGKAQNKKITIKDEHILRKIELNVLDLFPIDVGEFVLPLSITVRHWIYVLCLPSWLLSHRMVVGFTTSQAIRAYHH